MIREFTDHEGWEAAARAAGFVVWRVPPRTKLNVETGETFTELLVDNAYRGLAATEGAPSDTWPREDICGLWHPAIPEIVPTGTLDEIDRGEVADIMPAMPARGILADSAAEFRAYLLGEDR